MKFMPYSSVAELPPAVKDKLKGKQRRQWMHVWNSEYASHGDESRAFASAWAATKKISAVTFAKAEKISKQEANYKAQTTDNLHCSNCSMFQEPNGCTLVKGDIAPGGWCKYYEREKRTPKSALGKAAQMDEFQFFMPIAKADAQDDGTCIVQGYASTPTKDGDGEIVTLDAVKKALPGYMEWANIREMHQLKAVGKAQEANMDKTGLWLSARIVDPVAVKKCLDKVYQGFSIGGRKLTKSGNKITGIEMTEISVVDRPSNPDARFELAKSAKTIGDAAGYLIKVPKARATVEGKALAKMAKIVTSLAKAGPPAAHDGFSLPAKTVKADNPSPNDNSEQNNKNAAAGELCKEHGVAGCAKCAVKKDVASATEEPKIDAKKRAKKVQKAKLAAAFGLRKVDDFLTLRKVRHNGIAEEAAPVIETRGSSLAKSMGTAGSLAYCFDSVRQAQRSLMMEAKREGGDMKDKDLAKRLGAIAKDLASVISQKAEHEGEEALDFSDADDTYLSSYLGEDFGMVEKTVGTGNDTSGDPIADAVAALMKRAAQPTRAMRMAMAKADIDKSRKAAKAARKAVEDVHKMLKTSYIAKAAKAKKPKADDDNDDDFDHADAMGKLQKAYQEIDKSRDMAKAAGAQIEKMAGRSGQRGQEAGDSDGKFYQVPPGVRDLSPSDLATASPGGDESGSEPPLYPADGGRYPGKAAGGGDLARYAKNGMISADIAELILAKAKSEGELEVLRRLPAGGGGRQRPYSFDVGKVMGGTGGSDNGQLNKTLFDGVDANAIGSGDEAAHTNATSRLIGNLLTSPQFGKSILSTDFRGMAGNAKT